MRTEAAHARRRLQPALPAGAAGSKAHARGWPTRQAASHRGQLLRPERLSLRARALAPRPRRSARWRHDRGRRAHRRRDALSRRQPHHFTGRAERPPGARLRRRRHYLDAVPLPFGRDRLSRHRDRHCRNLAAAGVRLQGLGRGERRGAPAHLGHEGLAHRSVRSAAQGATGGQELPEDQHRTRRARAFRQGGHGAPADRRSGRRRSPQCRGARGHRPLRARRRPGEALKSLFLMLAIYAVPAVIFFGMTVAAVRVSNKGLLLPIERGAWILPGLVYTFVPAIVWKLEMTMPPKGLLNLVDPVLVALLCWFVFVGRITLAIKRPQINRQAPYAAIPPNMPIPPRVFPFLPPLPPY